MKAKCMRSRLYPMIIPVLFLIGCTDVIVSGDIASCHTPISAQATGSAVAQCQGVPPSGVAYALPKGELQLTWARTKPTPSDLQKAQSALSTAQQALAKDQSALATTQAKNANDPTIPSLQTQISADQSAVDAANSGLKAATAAQSFTETATLTVLPVVPDPDPKAHFVANLAHTALRNDNLNIGVTNGLLNSATAISADQTPSILTTLANTAITIAAMVGTGGIAAFGPAPAQAAPSAVASCQQDS